MTTRLSDDFAGTGAMSANWTLGPSEGGTLTRSSGVAIFSTGFDCAYYNNTDTPPADQWVEMVFGATPNTNGGGQGYGLTARQSTSVQTYYRLCADTAGYELLRTVAGAFTSITSGAGTTFTTGDRMRMEWVGTQPTMRKGGTEGNGDGTAFGSPPTDPNIASGVYGVAYSSSSPGGGIDKWIGGDFTSAAALPPIPLLMSQQQF